MTSYRSPFVGIQAGAPQEMDRGWAEVETPDDEPASEGEYNPYGYKYTGTTAERLQVGQMLCWTEADGWLDPPEKVLEPYSRGRKCLVLEREDGIRNPWTIRSYTRVRYLDTTPVFNDWGEEGL